MPILPLLASLTGGSLSLAALRALLVRLAKTGAGHAVKAGAKRLGTGVARAAMSQTARGGVGRYLTKGALRLGKTVPMDVGIGLGFMPGVFAVDALLGAQHEGDVDTALANSHAGHPAQLNAPIMAGIERDVMLRRALADMGIDFDDLIDQQTRGGLI